MNEYIKVLAVVFAIPMSVLSAVLFTQTVSHDYLVYAQTTDLQERLEKYKASLSVKPNQNELNRIKLRCNVAQTVLKNVSTRALKAQKDRVAAYDSITKNLNDLAVALKAKNIDTTKLETETKNLESKMYQYMQDVTDYNQVVADAAELKCSDDPLALRAAIQEAQAKLQALKAQVADIRNTVINVIKPTLKQIRQDLVTQQQATSTTPSQPTPQQPQGGTNAAQ